MVNFNTYNSLVSGSSCEEAGLCVGSFVGRVEKISMLMSSSMMMSMSMRMHRRDA